MLDRAEDNAQIDQTGLFTALSTNRLNRVDETAPDHFQRVCQTNGTSLCQGIGNREVSVSLSMVRKTTSASRRLRQRMAFLWVFPAARLRW